MRALIGQLIATIMLLLLCTGANGSETTTGLVDKFKSAAAAEHIAWEILIAVSSLNSGLVQRRGALRSDFPKGELVENLDALGIEIVPDVIGLMGLNEQQLAEAAFDLGVTVETIREEPHWSIRAGAYLIGKLARKYYTDDIESLTFGDYRVILAEFSGIDQPELSELYVDEVFELLSRGITIDGRVIVAPIEGDQFQGARYPENLRNYMLTEQSNFVGLAPGQSNSDLVDIYTPSVHYGNRRSDQISEIVIHTCESAGPLCASYLIENPRNVSAHYLITESGKVIQLVDEEKRANHVGRYNSTTIGIEHGGFADVDNWTSIQKDKSYALICDILKRHQSLTLTESVVSHAMLDPGRRHDPGRFYSFDTMRSAVNLCLDPPPIVVNEDDESPDDTAHRPNRRDPTVELPSTNNGESDNDGYPYNYLLNLILPIVVAVLVVVAILVKARTNRPAVPGMRNEMPGILVRKDNETPKQIPSGRIPEHYPKNVSVKGNSHRRLHKQEDVLPISIQDGDTIKYFALSGKPICLGRDPNCDFAILANNTISRRHCEIWYDDGQDVIYFRNTGLNGIEVNGCTLLSNEKGKAAPAAEISLTLADIELMIRSNS